jgi:hypothetical protein
MGYRLVPSELVCATYSLQSILGSAKFLINTKTVSIKREISKEN